MLVAKVGQNHTYWYRCGTFGRDFIEYTVIYSAYIRLWPTLLVA